MFETEMVSARDVRCQKIVAVIPAYNEARFIGSVVLRAQKFAHAVVVVDDGSTDATADIAEAAGAIVIRHERNQGKGFALNTGFRKARELGPDVVITLDGDGQHVPDEMTVVAEPVLEGYADIAVGSRYLEKKSRVPLHRIWGHQVFNFVTGQAAGVSLTDSQSGFRAFSPHAIGSIAFHERGFSVECEMQFLAREHQLKMAEVPITILYHDKPKRSVIGQGLMVLNGILRLVGQYRPLLFFGMPGILVLLAGMVWGLRVVDIYLDLRTLPIGYALISVLLSIVGVLGLFTGIILHSVRGLLMDLIRLKGNQEIGA
jgi:glycosyltransferase involved in cell wall biosynthesis